MPKRFISSISSAELEGSASASLVEASDNARKTPRSIAASQPHAIAAKRRVTSCAACRKQKIKCELPTERPPCERCKRRNIECVINTGLRNSILDQRQLAVLGRDLSKVHGTLELVCKQLGVELPKPLESALNSLSAGAGIQDGLMDDGEDGLYEPAQQNSPTAVQAPIDAYLTQQEVTPPGGQSQNLALASRLYKKPDLISKDLITLEDAEILVNHYFIELDPIVYGFVKTHKTIHGLREASPALIAAVCTVGALHHVDRGHLFETCYREYRHVISSTLFERQDIEHIRALCVGSFWLPGSSRILLCDAVRRAGDVRLHRYILKAIHDMADTAFSPSNGSASQSESRDRVRLWYGLFMCDQHQSILNNRESLLPIHLEVLERRGEYLDSDACIHHDLRLVAQSSLLLIMARMKRTFGSEYAAPVAESRAPEFPEFSRELDEWIDRFEPKFHPGPEMGKFPSLAFRLHYHFAKLYLGHNVFRGLQGNTIPNSLLPAARMAYDSAVAIFRMILEADGLLSNLWKVPSYIHIMISFAGHLLLELCVKHREQLNINVEEDYRILDAVVSALTNIRLVSSHPLIRVATGLRKRLFDFAALYGKESLAENGEVCSQRRENSTHVATSAAPYNMPPELAKPGPSLDMDAMAMPNEFFFMDFNDFTFQDASTDFPGI
ncbi:hypothetical protein QQS21_001955 [Conoideocrella luteorostrata]|uniref:Zn(2)-C6 fungal-type domain-containing protein n=1 Tax=Conoideocrella luteorostrata TaxID=1105319 RepID=A0AAJ0CYU8_9HYPO|nr:hypothetical protein QQS21_001955 [Conoideocrella luteorostrata]